jgi:hypothetical protein
MVVIDNVLMGLVMSADGRVGRVMPDWILDGVRGMGVSRMCEHVGRGVSTTGEPRRIFQAFIHTRKLIRCARSSTGEMNDSVRFPLMLVGGRFQNGTISKVITKPPLVEKYIVHMSLLKTIPFVPIG